MNTRYVLNSHTGTRPTGGFHWCDFVPMTWIIIICHLFNNNNINSDNGTCTEYFQYDAVGFFRSIYVCRSDSQGEGFLSSNIYLTNWQFVVGGGKRETGPSVRHRSAADWVICIYSFHFQGQIPALSIHSFRSFHSLNMCRTGWCQFT